MTILITRPVTDSIALKNHLDKLGIDVFIEPMLDLSIYPQDPEINFNEFDALIFTSKNSVEHLKLYNVTSLKHKLCFAIGSTTKNSLMELGFNKIYSANNKVETLINQVTSIPQISSKTMYFRGKDIRHNLQAILQKKDFVCVEKICYETKPRTTFSDELLQILKEKKVKAVILFSYNTAKTFFNLCSHYNVVNCLKESKIIAAGDGLYNELQNLNIDNVTLFQYNISQLPSLLD